MSQSTQNAAPQPAPIDAQVWPAHAYYANPDYASHDGLADEHRPCTCGSAETAFIHSDEARKGNVTITSVAAGDGGVAGEAGSLANGGNGAALMLPGTDTREGTPLETQEPGTTRTAVGDEPVGAAEDQAAAPAPAQPVVVDSVGAIDDVR